VSVPLGQSVVMLLVGWLQPVDTRDISVSDKRRCREVYLQVKELVQNGVETLLRSVV